MVGREGDDSGRADANPADRDDGGKKSVTGTAASLSLISISLSLSLPIKNNHGRSKYRK